MAPFPLLPGTKCPTGQVCRSRNVINTGAPPMVNSLESGLKIPLKASMDWQELNNYIITVVKVRESERGWRGEEDEGKGSGNLQGRKDTFQL